MTIDEPLIVKQALERVTIFYRTKEGLIYLSATCKWGINGNSISYRNFARRAWSKIVAPIKPDTTPYSCRDTFITTQLIKGVSSGVIAKWLDTSTQMIDRNYADKLKLTQQRPGLVYPHPKDVGAPSSVGFLFPRFLLISY